MRRFAACTALVLVATVPSGGRAAPVAVPAETGRFYNILPPGQHGSTNSVEGARFALESQQDADAATRPAHFDDQLAMYAELVYASPGLSDADITKYFKIAGFTVPPDDVTRVEKPRPGLTIVRDRFDIPHIYGNTAEDAVFGAGYVTGEDRLFVTDVLRHVGRARVSEFLGASESNLHLDRDVARVAGYTEEELQFQMDQLPKKFGSLGELSVQAAHAFTDGMNAWITEALTDPTKLPVEYPALQLALLPWKETDIVAVATLIQSIFAAGGGGEMGNVQLLQGLEKKYPASAARKIFRDLLNREDPDAPVSIEDSFPYEGPGPVDPDAVAIPDPGSYEGTDPFQTLTQSLAKIGISVPSATSNWLAVTADRAADGHPIAVMGPQTGYFSPNLLLELDMHGGSIHSRGAAFPGISLAVLLGRGIDFAWSATSGGSDLVDIRIERLCERDGSPPTKGSTSYMIDGNCTPMYQRVDRFVAKPSAGGVAAPEVITHTVERTVHGPVIGRATVEGKPVAVVYQRSTWFGEYDSAPAFTMLNTNQVRDPETFYEAMNYVTGSFNWLYTDADDIAFFHSGLYPQRAPGIDPELPYWGDRRALDWQGFVPLEEHPHGANPPQGYIASWNNKPARDWHAADANYGYSPVYRVQSLTERLAPAAAAGGVTMTQMIDIMEDAATVDVRGSQVIPYALQVLGDDPEVATHTALLRDWVEHGAHRRAPSRDAPYDRQAAVALMDAWYEPLIHAIFDDELKDLYGVVPLGYDDGNRLGHIGSAFQGGYYGHLQKALRQALGQPVGAPYQVLSCGGTLVACRAALKQSLVGAVASLQQRFGGGPDTWTVDKSMETIRFSAVGLVTVPEIDWQNRPTFQQLVQVMRRRES